MKRRPPVVCVLVSGLLLAGCATTARHRQLSSLAVTQRQAEQAYARGDLQQALEGYQALTEAMPKQADFWLRLGNVQFRQGQPHYAAKSYLQALQLDPANAGAWHNLGIVRLREAEAAFVQAAEQGSRNDPLRQSSTAMADGIAQLTGVAKNAVKSDVRTSSAAAPTTKGDGP